MGKGFVEYVMKDGTSRDAIVVKVGKEGKLNLMVFFDGSNDRGNFPANVMVNVDHQVAAWVKEVAPDSSEKPKAGTYHEIEYKD